MTSRSVLSEQLGPQARVAAEGSVCAVRGRRRPRSSLSMHGPGRPGATHPGSVLSVGEWVLRARFATDAGEIAWDRLGTGPPLVLVHGTPWSSWTWRRVAPRLAERFSVYVFDLLGFGASDKRRGQDVSLAGHGARLAALLEHWQLDRPALVAHDIGGAAALRAHLLHRRSVAALVLIDVVALAPWGSPFYRLVRDHESVFEQLPAAIHEGVLRAYVGTAQPRPLASEVEDRLIAPWLGASGQAAFYRQIAAGTQRHTDEIEPLLGKISVPTLVVWGEADPWLPAAVGAELAARIPGARLTLLPGAGHLVQEDQPDEVTRLIGVHLESVFT
jgi:pimeloyl-ACP methyl ester carboxylesterase